jgi:uncharacterized protein involved in outer membrane biogenesis
LTLVAGLTGLVLLSVIIAVIYVSANLGQHKNKIEKIVEEATGREALIEGDLHLGLSLIPTVAVDGVSFGNAAWGTQPQMATVKSIEVKIALLPLLSGDIMVERLILIEPDIFIETDAEGRGNVLFELLSMLNPFAKDEPYTTLKCAVVRYDIKNGMAKAEKGIAIETDKLLILGAGNINLKNQQLALLVESTPKDDVVAGSLMSLITVGDVSLAGLVQVGGAG